MSDVRYCVQSRTLYSGEWGTHCTSLGVTVRPETLPKEILKSLVRTEGYQGRGSLSYLLKRKVRFAVRYVICMYFCRSLAVLVTKFIFFVMSFLRTSTALGRHASPLGNSVRSRLTWCPRRSRLRSGPKPLGIKINISLFLWIIETTPNCVGSRRVVKVTDQLTEIPQRTLQTLRRTLRRHLSTESPAVLPREAVRPAWKRCARRGAAMHSLTTQLSDSTLPGHRSTTQRRDAHSPPDKPAQTQGKQPSCGSVTLRAGSR